MNILNSFFTVIVLLALGCSNNEVSEGLLQKTNFPKCEQLEIVEMGFTKAQSLGSSGDTLKVQVKNNCKSCTPYVYTGLIAFQNQDTLAIDILFTSERSPENGESKEYLLKVAQSFRVEDITRLEMYLVCDSLTL
jgi:hypothetical protein